MKNINLFLGILFVIAGLKTTAQITFEKRFMGSDCYDVQPTPDTCYAILKRGYSSSLSLCKLNGNGDSLWAKQYAINSTGRCLKQTTDGGFILCGETTAFGAGGNDAYLVKTNSRGDTLWTRTYGGSNEETANSVQQTTDGGYIVAGYTRSFGAGAKDAFLLRIDGNGDTLWTRVFQGVNDDEAHSVQQTSDGGYIVAGYINGFPGGNKDVYLIKTGSNGDTLWTKTFGGGADDIANSVRQTNDGGYIIVGYANSFGSDAYIIKTNVNGDTLWTKTIGASGNNEAANSIEITADNRYIIAGKAGLEVFLISMDANGDTLWTKTMQESINESYAHTVKQAQDSGFIIAATSVNSIGTSSSSGYFIKTDKNGNSGCNGSPSLIIDSPSTLITSHSTQLTSGGIVGYAPHTASSSSYIIRTICSSIPDEIEEQKNQGGLSVFPNPTEGMFTLTLPDNNVSHTAIIYDFLGQVIYQSTHTNNQSIDISGHPKGIYFIKISDDRDAIMRKIVLQ